MTDLPSTFFIVFKLNGENWLLCTEQFVDHSFCYLPLASPNVEHALAYFDDYSDLIKTNNSPIDPTIQSHSAKLMYIYPVIHECRLTPDEFLEFAIDIQTQKIKEFRLLNVPYQLWKMKSSFSQFAVLEVAPHLLNRTVIGENGYMTIHQSERIFPQSLPSDN